MKKIFEQASEGGEKFLPKKFEREDECHKDLEEVDMPTQFLRIQQNQLIDLNEYLERYVKNLIVFGCAISR